MKKFKKLLAVLVCVVMVFTAMPITNGLLASAATSGTTGNCTWTLDGTTLTISGNGAMGDYSSIATLPWEKSITKVEIKDGVTSIGYYAFYNCTRLTSVTIGDSVTSIGVGAFKNCTSLTSITIPDSVTSMGSDAFYYCSKLNKVNITDIGAWCNISFGSSDANPLYRAKKLYLNDEPLFGKIVIPEGVTKIPDYTFYDCGDITSITIPSSVTNIGKDAFYNCTSLTKVNITDIEAWCNISFSSYPQNPLYYAKSLYLNGKLVTSLVIPDGVTNINDYAFYNCESITDVTIPDSVTSIGSSAFRYCTSLTSVTIPDSVTSIGFDAFHGCTGLTKVNITDIDAWCNISFGNPYANPLYYAKKLYLNGELVTDLIIPKTVESVGNYAFYYCTSLKSVTIGDSVTSIGSSAFYYCTSLISITIGNGVTDIGSDAFDYCSNLKIVNINDLNAWCNISFGTSDASPLYYAKNLYLNNELVTNINLPEGIQIYEEKGFNYCQSLKSIYIPKDIILIKQNAFYGCNNITDIYYEGTAEEWEEITILSDNGSLSTANVYFNSSGVPGALESIEITKLPTKLSYIENKESLDLAGGVLTLKYNGGATSEIDLSTLTVTGFDNSKLGKQTITVKYGEFSATFEVEVIYRPMAFVSIAQNPTKTVYEVGESLDLSGAKLGVVYPEGEFEYIDITEDMVSGFNPNRPSIQILTVTYKGYTDVLVVTVFPKIADDENEIDILDIIYIKEALLNFGEDYPVSYDVNGDGVFNSLDMVTLRKKLFESF